MMRPTPESSVITFHSLSPGPVPVFLEMKFFVAVACARLFEPNDSCASSSSSDASRLAPSCFDSSSIGVMVGKGYADCAFPAARALIDVMEAVADGAVYGEGGWSVWLCGLSRLDTAEFLLDLEFGPLRFFSASSAATAPSMAEPNTTDASMYLGITIGSPVQSASNLISNPLRHWPPLIKMALMSYPATSIFSMMCLVCWPMNSHAARYSTANESREVSILWPMIEALICGSAIGDLFPWKSP
ncbi:hypothetical protein OGATHE_004499 [Ogataea polymorpha]|uniref:Uncharacterized protein n=1 Tax=Ogataea polymorpha TaxID=460523 RepID=A0A9P8NZS4_9ASCO|nr:hypothetical protein OGATHE_004499 [Ogataea polymorpha]